LKEGRGLKMKGKGWSTHSPPAANVCMTGTTSMGGNPMPLLLSSQPSYSQLLSQDSRERVKQHQIWKEISGLQTTCSTPLSISGSELAVGGDKGSVLWLRDVKLQILKVHKITLCLTTLVH
jgi:hypothetical protein